MDVKKIKTVAEQELKEEQFRELVEKEKNKIKNRCGFWQRIFPFKVKIERRCSNGL
jgi:hypothetical protein